MGPSRPEVDTSCILSEKTLSSSINVLKNFEEIDLYDFCERLGRGAEYLMWRELRHYCPYFYG